ncbi:MAG: hypothetical protein HKN42_02430 [Granulosicoccus sp.]|nr:hypothetical protein [Granulosicoccus sp.]
MKLNSSWSLPAVLSRVLPGTLPGALSRARMPVGKNSARLVELAVFAWLLPVGGLLAFTGDPIGLAFGFPWVICGSLVFAARYGSAWGVACAALTGGFINLPFEAYAQYEGQAVALALGMLVLSLIVGDVASSWRSRSRQSEAENQYLRHRLKEFSTDYHVLKVSHGQLEEHMAGQRLSLREALQRLKPVLCSNGDGIQAGSELMAVFSQFCSIQVAGLYAMSSDTRVEKTPVATHGDMYDLPVFDPLLRTAITERELVSIKLEALAERHHEHSLLAVVPLVDTQGKLHGVLAIKDMHFMAFQQLNLNLLALLGSYVGNLLTRSQGSAESRTDWFMAELDTALRFAHSHDTESVLLSLKFNKHESVNTIAEFVSNSIRGLDASWMPDTSDGSTVLCLLLPLMNDAQAHAFMQRVDGAVRGRFGQSLASVVIDTQQMCIDSGDSRAQCLAFLSRHTGQAILQAGLHPGLQGNDKLTGTPGRQSGVL